jgi:hypothetical protein
VDRLAAHERDEEYYLNLASPVISRDPTGSPKDSNNQDLMDGNDGHAAPGANYDPRHVSFLLEQGIMEVFAENSSLGRLLPEYKYA